MATASQQLKRRPGLIDGEPRTIVHVIAASVAGTGVDTFVQQLCAAQRRGGDRPVLCSDAESRAPLFGWARESGVEVRPLPARPVTNWPHKVTSALHQLRQVAFIRSQLRRGAADLLHLHVVGCEGLTAYLAALSSRAPTVVTQHTLRNFLDGDSSRRTRLTLALGRKLADRMVFPYGEGVEEYLREGLPRRRLAVVPLCADEELFTTRATPPQAGGPFRVLVSARLVPGKGHGELLEAVERLGSSVPRLEVVIAGEGPERPTLEAAVARRNLQDRVHFLGQVPRQDLPALLASVHASVLPTYMTGETFPVSLLEAALAGLPAISTRWFGIPEIIVHEQTGLLVEPRDAAGLAAAMARLAGDPALWRALSDGAHRRGHERFAAGRVAEQYDAVYQAALRDH